MRLIDADDLNKTIDKEIYRHDTLDHVFQIIDNAPTIEPKRGKWLERNSGFIKWIRCSECNHKIYQGIKTDFNFCPNCGADMTEREGE